MTKITSTTGSLFIPLRHIILNICKNDKFGRSERSSLGFHLSKTNELFSRTLAILSWATSSSRASGIQCSLFRVKVALRYKVSLDLLILAAKAAPEISMAHKALRNCSYLRRNENRFYNSTLFQFKENHEHAQRLRELSRQFLGLVQHVFLPFTIMLWHLCSRRSS